MIRYIKLYKKFFKTNLKVIKSYDYDMILGIVGMIIKNIINIVVIQFVFCKTDSIGGYDFYQILFIYSLSLVSYAIWHCFFINTLTIPYYIKDGTFDNFLTRPLSPLFQIMVDGFDEDGWGDLIIGIALLFISAHNLDIMNFKLLLVIPLAIICSLVYAGITIMLSSLCFFTIDNSGMASLVIDLHDFAKYPLTIFSKPLRFILTVVLPIAFTAYYPALYFISPSIAHFYMLLFSIVVSLLFFFISTIVWKFGLSHYSSSGH